jgi:four helix bundle protein
MHNFKELKIWQNGRQFVKDTYQLTYSFPKEELFGLTQQMRRAAVSIPSNIAEGCGRNTDRQLIHFLDIAIGSSFELETQIILASDLDYIPEQKMIEMTNFLRNLQQMTISFKLKIESNLK